MRAHYLGSYSRTHLLPFIILPRRSSVAVNGEVADSLEWEGDAGPSGAGVGGRCGGVHQPTQTSCNVGVSLKRSKIKSWLERRSEGTLDSKRTIIETPQRYSRVRLKLQKRGKL